MEFLKDMFVEVVRDILSSKLPLGAYTDGVHHGNFNKT